MLLFAGTWAGITHNLDMLQDMGMTAVRARGSQEEMQQTLHRQGPSWQLHSGRNPHIVGCGTVWLSMLGLCFVQICLEISIIQKQEAARAAVDTLQSAHRNPGGC